jgi:hypothetical protein
MGRRHYALGEARPAVVAERFAAASPKLEKPADMEPIHALPLSLPDCGNATLAIPLKPAQSRYAHRLPAQDPSSKTGG